MFEPKVITKVDLPKVVETNLNELEGVIADKIALADSLAVTNDEDSVKAADADATELKKMSDRVARFRRDFVAWWKAPVDAVETMCKGYEKRLAEAAANLRAKTQEVKDMWANDRRDELEDLLTTRLSDAFPEDQRIVASPFWEAWFAERTDPKTKGNWLNKGTRQSAIDAEIAERIESVKGGRKFLADTIGKESTEVRVVAFDAWLAAFSTEDALREVYRFKQEQERIAEAKREEAEQASAPEPTPAPAPTQKQKVLVQDPIDGLLTFRLAVTGSKTALLAMKEFCQQNGIKIVNLDRVVGAN